MGLMQLQPKNLGNKEVGHMQRLRKRSVGVSEISKEVWTPLLRQQCTYIFAFVRIYVALVKLELVKLESMNEMGCREATVIN